MFTINVLTTKRRRPSPYDFLVTTTIILIWECPRPMGWHPIKYDCSISRWWLEVYRAICLAFLSDCEGKFTKKSPNSMLINAKITQIEANLFTFRSIVYSMKEKLQSLRSEFIFDGKSAWRFQEDSKLAHFQAKSITWRQEGRLLTLDTRREYWRYPATHTGLDSCEITRSWHYVFSAEFKYDLILLSLKRSLHVWRHTWRRKLQWWWEWLTILSWVP